ncbi:putative permease [gamma proteobacterium IMCC2047]|nr:putative permease [gamma proteobacterium IMCC2047]
MVLTSRLVRYISEVASGDIAADFLFYLIVFRLPDILLMVLPISLLLAILLVFGRMYIENEMAVFSASGVSLKKLAVYAMASVSLVSLTVAALSFSLAPWGLKKVDELFVENANRTVFETVRAGRFSPMGEDNMSLYAERLSDDQRVMSDVFIAREANGKKSNFQIMAEQGYLEVKPNSLAKYLILKNGYRYEGDPGSRDYKVTQFETFGIKLSSPPEQVKENSTRGMATGELLKLDSSTAIAELQWRISLPLLVPIIALLGVPLSRVNPRQGRFYFLIPAMLFYFAYLVLLSGMKTAVEENTISPWLGLWWVHVMFLCLALLVFLNLHKKILSLLHFRRLQRK